MQCRRVRCGARAEEQAAKEEKQRGGADLEWPFGKSPAEQMALPASWSPRRVQRPNPMKESPAAARSTVAGTTSSAAPPTTTASAWLRSVATTTPPRTAPRGSRAASAKARSWVLSPISAAPMRPSVVTKTVMVGHDETAREASLQRGVRGRVHSDRVDREHDLLTHREAGVRNAEVPTVDGGRGVGAPTGPLGR